MTQAPDADIQLQTMQAVDQMVQDGSFVFDEQGGLRPSDTESSVALLDQRREQRKESREIDLDDNSDQERLILGFTLFGEKDNSSIWSRFRQALGLRPDQPVPESLWSSKLHAKLSEELDAIFCGQRDVRILNGRTLIESYQLRVQRDQVNGSIQALSQSVAELRDEAGSFVENDMLIAIELLQSSRARSILRTAGMNLATALKRDRPVESIVQDMLDSISKARDLVAGRLSEEVEFDSFSNSASALREAMTQQRSQVMSTGIAALDMDLQGGVCASDTGKLNVIAARTGVGKTTVGIAAAMGLARSGAHVLFLSCELSGLEITARSLSNYGFSRGINDCPSWRLEGRSRTRDVPGGFERLLSMWASERKSGTVGEFTSKACFHSTAENMADMIYAAKARNPKLSSVFIDHFHALAPSKGYSNRSQEMEARILFLHQTAKSCKVDLFLMAQLNREACLTETPRLDHINGTDAIAQLATAVWLLEFDKSRDKFDPAFLSLFHGKFRNGQRHNGNFVNCERSELALSREMNAVTSEYHVGIG